MIDRKDFLKLSILAFVSVWLPQIVMEPTTIIDWDIDNELFKKALKVEKGTSKGLVCSIDTKWLCDNLTLMDSRGRRWRIDVDGKTFWEVQ